MTIQVQIQQGIAPKHKTSWKPDLGGTSKKDCIHDGRVKNNHRSPPENSRMPEDPFIQSSKSAEM